MTAPEVDLTVYPDECDAFGHLNQASFLSLFERARWEVLARGPGMDLFSRTGTFPALRKATIEYHASAFPGDVLRFVQTPLQRGRTSFSLRQVARRVGDNALIASGEFLFVCIDRQGHPVPVPDQLDQFMADAAGARPKRAAINGVNLVFDDEGEGPAILFVHGYPLNRSIWQDQVRDLNGYRRIAPDLRGLGASDAPDLGYSMATYAADLHALLDHLGVEQAVVCGLSMGGYVALEFVRAYPDRVLALVLMASRAEADSAEARKGRDQAAATAREKGSAAIAESMLPRMLAPGSYQDTVLVTRVKRMMAESPVPGVVGALTAMRDRADNTSLLAGLTLPVLIVAGESDQLIPLDNVARMNDAATRSILRVMPKAGHLIPVEQPEATTQILREFLQGLS